MYRLNTDRARASLPAWGIARFIERYANKDTLLGDATYTTCPPKDRAWYISAESIHIDNAKSKGVARHATLKVRDMPLLYTPYLSFPTAKQRKTGFLMPAVGYSNVGGFDFGTPLYLNLAPNYDATVTPHIYSRCGVMLGGEVRYTAVGGQYLPNDRAFKQFIDQNKAQFPSLSSLSNNRWYASILNSTQLNPNLRLGINFQEVSDDYYLQDFSTNLAVTTESQILRQADLTYTSDHWKLQGLVQGYQTLHPINQSEVSDIYQRLPQFSANGTYNELPFNGSFNLLARC